MQSFNARRSQNPPLLKSSKHDNLEGRPFRAETQTLEELRAIKSDVDYIMIELFFARQRILEGELYNEYLLPLVDDFIFHKMNEYRQQAGEGTGAKKEILPLLYAFKIQKQLSVHPNPCMLKEKIKWLDMLCQNIELKRTVDLSDFSAILDFIEVFYGCGNSENACIMTKKTYVHLLEFLYRIITMVHIVNDEDKNIEALTKKFLLLTRGSKESYLRPFQAGQ